MKSICFAHKDISTIDKGGVCVLFKTLMSGLVKNKWQVSCITQSDFAMPGVKVIKMPKNPDPFSYSNDLASVIDILSPDIVECSNWKFELLTYSLQKNKGSKIVVRFDPPAGTLFGQSASYLEPYEKRLCQNADKIICVSKFSQKELERKYKIKDSCVVYNGIDTERINELKKSFSSVKLDEKKINVYWCGKTTKMKGFDLLLPIIESSSDTIHWIINIGNSVEEIKGIEELSKIKSVSILKNIPRDLQINYWKACDIFLSSSRVEGFSLALGEALSLGLPCILNKNCRVFSEFIPNDYVHLVSFNNEETVIKKIMSVNLKQKKSPDSVLDKKFSSNIFIKNSINIYNKL